MISRTKQNTMTLCLKELNNYSEDHTKDCGERPKKPKNPFNKPDGEFKSSNKYKSYLTNLKKWENCMKQNSSNFNDDSGLNSFENFEKECMEFFDRKRTDPIEGIWVFSYNGTNYGKYAIKESGEGYLVYAVEKFNWIAGKIVPGELVGNLEQMASDKIFLMKDLKNNRTQNCVMENDVMLECYSSGVKYTALKTYPKSGFSNPSKRSSSKEWVSNGSGIIISTNGHIITNYHVIDEASEIEVEFIYNGDIQKFKAEIIKDDKINDLSIIKISDENFNGLNDISYNFKTRSSDVGTKVYAYGYPWALSAMGSEIKVTDGIISSKTGFDGDITKYQITAPIQGGNSGGPLFDEKGNLIGINSSKIIDDRVENVAYTIKSSYILNLIDILPTSINLPSDRSLETMSLTEQIKNISKYVVLIKTK